MACDAGHPRYVAAKRDTRIQDPRHEDPTNYKSRNDWSRALNNSKIPTDAKRYIKSLENTATDGWEQTFEGSWKKIEEHLDRGLPLTDDVLLEYITSSAKKQLQNLDVEQFESAFNGLYVEAREQAYKLMGYGDRKKGLK